MWGRMENDAPCLRSFTSATVAAIRLCHTLRMARPCFPPVSPPPRRTNRHPQIRPAPSPLSLRLPPPSYFQISTPLRKAELNPATTPPGTHLLAAIFFTLAPFHEATIAPLGAKFSNAHTSFPEGVVSPSPYPSFCRYRRRSNEFWH